MALLFLLFRIAEHHWFDKGVHVKMICEARQRFSCGVSAPCPTLMQQVMHVIAFVPSLALWELE